MGTEYGVYLGRYVGIETEVQTVPILKFMILRTDHFLIRADEQKEWHAR